MEVSIVFDVTSRDKEVPLNLLFLKLPFLSKSATLTNSRRSEGDDLCVLRSQGREGRFSLFYILLKSLVLFEMTSLLLDENRCVCVLELLHI